MVNPYELSSRQNQRKQVSLASSNALKKFEKLQAKHTGKPPKSKKSYSINSSGDENSIFRNDADDGDEDEDSVFKNLNKNKFVKAKPKAEKNSDSEKSEMSDTDLEISIADRSSTPNRKSSIQRPSSRLRSEASSANELYSSNLPKRSPSRVKFLKQDSITDQEESQVEDLLGKNLVLTIDDLEPADNKFAKKPKSKSPISSERRTASIYEEDELSTATVSTQSPSLMNANVILDIHELDKSESSVSKSSSKSSKKKSKDKRKKRSKTPNSVIETETDYRTADSSIATEIGEKKYPRSESELDVLSQSHHRSSYKDKSYYDDFETDQDFTLVSRAEKSKRKQLTFAENKKEVNSIEIQVDPNDLLRHSDLIRSVNVYNPSSLLLASVSFLNQGTNLKDLNQLTGFNLINQTFNDLIRMNVNFMKNFLATQKSLYEQQIASIQPK
ncbi:hypothetical protein BpHYR1_051587 [Brachionus plicatilis]|uniref:Uncharacterized protein n=1 Tax=Brachionus plicatilis TaxID=10195 RepID=A0A3M7PQY9_BRAPC|nr:hypothetical protein BpHYR1_051587 [Brachionus plicatilis]